MNEIKATFTPDVKDYRAAVFFAAFIRYSKHILLFLIVTLTAVACWLSALVGLMPPFMLPAYIAMGYLVWLTFIAARLEHGILSYTKAPDTILYKEMSVTFAKGNMIVSTPYNGKKSTIPLDKLFYGAELKNLFIIYLDSQQSILLPCRALTPPQRSEVRSLLMNALKDSFSTRYGYNGMLPRRSPLRK